MMCNAALFVRMGIHSADVVFLCAAAVIGMGCSFLFVRKSGKYVPSVVDAVVLPCFEVRLVTFATISASVLAVYGCLR